MTPPAGTVTFLFSDIEGSTKLWEQQPDAMRPALARHDALLRRAIDTGGGFVFKTAGDSFCAAFADAPAALSAALAAQRALHGAEGEEIGPLKVRMALHTGAAQARDADYFGPPLNRVARLLAAGHGGQTLLSAATRLLAQDALPEGAFLRDLGEKRLKDLSRAEPIFQLCAPDLPTSFPPLRTLDRRPHNLPVPPTLLVGREEDAARAGTLLGRARLLTLTGPGGTGKTRLSLQVAADVLEDFADGVFLVSLAPLSDPNMVVSAIARTLGACEAPGVSPLGSVQSAIGERPLLLVLDNMEQVVDAAPQVAELLAACPNLKVLTTSRIALRVRGEQEMPVPPLSLPRRSASPPSLAALSSCAAVQVFVERAQSVRPDFSLTAQNAPAVAEICARLDGLPLALELAAARVKMLPPETLLSRLGLALLTGGARDLPERQQTLRRAIAWSYDLLDAADKLLLARLAVFAGGCTLDAAEAVCGDGLEKEVLDGLASLTDSSLLRQEENEAGEPRFLLLETIRAFALELLDASSERDALRCRHRDYFMRLVHDTRDEAGWEGTRYMTASEREAYMRLLGAEQDNLRAALDWCEEDPEGAQAGLQLAREMVRFWWRRGELREGWRRLTAALAHKGASARTLTRARALAAAAETAFQMGDLDASRALFEESLALFREVGSKAGCAGALDGLACVAFTQGDLDHAADLYEESLAAWREVGFVLQTAAVLLNLATLALKQDKSDAAAAHRAEAVVLLQSIEEPENRIHAWEGLARLADEQGNLEAARGLCEKCLAEAQAAGDRWAAGRFMDILADMSARQGDWGAARVFWEQSLQIGWDLKDKWDIANVLVGLTRAADAQGQPERVARLLGAVQTLNAEMSRVPNPQEPSEELDFTAAARAALGEEAFAAALAEGRAAPLEQVVADALAGPPSALLSSPAPPSALGVLY